MLKCKYNADHPTPAQLIGYLAFLCGSLRHSTVINHSSALFNFLPDTVVLSIKDSKQFQKFMQGLTKSQPRSAAAFIWSVEPVLTFLSKDVFPQNHLYYMGRHIALLMLLLGGRRVHDLSLLSRKPELLMFSHNEVTLQPIFGSKTDKSHSIQSPMTFVNGVDYLLSVPQLLKHYLKITTPVCGSCTALFVSPQQPTSACDAQKLRSWVKKLLEIAGVGGTAGATRAAAATSGFISGLTVQQLMDRGNWKSARVMFNHYMRF